MRARSRQLGVRTIHRLDADEAEIALALLGRTHLPRHLVPGAQPEPAYLRLRDIHVAGAGTQALLTQEAVAVANDLQQAGGKHVPLTLGDGLQQVEDYLLPSQGAILHAHFMGQLDQLFLGHSL